jgi:hypothetical protein
LYDDRRSEFETRPRSKPNRFRIGDLTLRRPQVVAARVSEPEPRRPGEHDSESAHFYCRLRRKGHRQSCRDLHAQFMEREHHLPPQPGMR